MTCEHCGEAIEQWPTWPYWIHEASRSAYCDESGATTATPHAR